MFTFENIDVYKTLFWAYLVLAVLTLLPTIKDALMGVKLNPGGVAFESSLHFSPNGKKMLHDHFTRLAGTLGFWKKRAETYRSFHFYCVIWTILSAWAVPIIASLTPAGGMGNSPYAKFLIVLVSGHVALALSFHKGLKVAEGMKALRHGESEFYDLFRRLLDRPKTLAETEEQQIDIYFSEVERIRKLVRNAETETLPNIENSSAIQHK